MSIAAHVQLLSAAGALDAAETAAAASRLPRTAKGGAGELTIFFRMTDDSVHATEVAMDARLIDLKRAIEQQFAHLPAANQRIVFGDKEIDKSQDDALLSDLELSNEAMVSVDVITVWTRQRGRGWAAVSADQRTVSGPGMQQFTFAVGTVPGTAFGFEVQGKDDRAAVGILAWSAVPTIGPTTRIETMQGAWGALFDCATGKVYTFGSAGGVLQHRPADRGFKLGSRAVRVEVQERAAQVLFDVDGDAAVSVPFPAGAGPVTAFARVGARHSARLL